ncbi:ester cyclase [Temperatibacter marinus]|uniref:Ester cyclase n=1 Tax=Temperatibacter marinus TaxID=1456591 RepID=A0AA52HAW1_9PROT|nr:ester cyclase [Temperatibacter marinus]WND03023.1 ester cyclase [Temperatibacter marinus]
MKTPSPLPVTLCSVTDLSDMLTPKGPRRQPMKGFDDEFIDIVDYIVRITYRIWDEKQVDLCKRYYADSGNIQTLAGNVMGVDTVIKNTWATLEGFPDRTLDADNVVWSGDDNEGFYSSHLITSHMTNLGPSEYGEPTGRTARIQTIADCVCLENKIVEEWLMRDNLGLAQQIGQDGHEIAKRQALSDHESQNDLRDIHLNHFNRTMNTDVSGYAKKPSNPEDDATAFAQAVFGTLWNNRSLKQADQYYDYRADVNGPSGRRYYGAKQVISYIESLLEVMPDLKVTVDHVADVPYLEGARDIAVRWSLAGTHTGDGMYGTPTGEPIYILGGSHFRVINGRIRSEWTVWDELAVLRQVERNRLITGK